MYSNTHIICCIWPCTHASSRTNIGYAHSSCIYFIGNIISAVLVASLLPYGFELAMMACSFLMFLGGILIFLCLPEHPDKVGESVTLNYMYFIKLL